MTTNPEELTPLEQCLWVLRNRNGYNEAWITEEGHLHIGHHFLSEEDLSMRRDEYEKTMIKHGVLLDPEKNYEHGDQLELRFE